MTVPERSDRITVEFAGEYRHFYPMDEAFTIGREGTIAVDDNPFLHRHLLRVGHGGGLWWLANVGTRLAVTVADGAGRVHAQLDPGARLPIVFHRTIAVFTAGRTTYEVSLYADVPAYEAMPASADGGETTVGAVPLTVAQRQLLLAMAEPMLRGDGVGMSRLRTTVQLAERLGWTTTAVNRKIDNVCDKLAAVGVAGLRRGDGSQAANRRIRLVEHALAARLVTREDLHLLDGALKEAQPDRAGRGDEG